MIANIKKFTIISLILVKSFLLLSCGDDKNQAIVNEDEMTELVVFRDKAFIYAMNAKKIGDELFWHLEVKQNVYFDTVYELNNAGKLIKRFAIVFEEFLKPSSATVGNEIVINNHSCVIGVAFKDVDGFLIHSQEITTSGFTRNPQDSFGEHGWGYYTKESIKLGKDKINRIAYVEISPKFYEEIEKKIDEHLKSVATLSLTIKDPTYTNTRYQNTKSLSPEIQWSKN